MSDISSYITQDAQTGLTYIDWLMDGPDLASDDGLATAVLISLYTDRLACPDDEIPDAAPLVANGPPDRRGWWGDTPADASQSMQPSSLTGSRFWLRAGWPANERTARQIELDAQEALQWMIDGKIAQSIDVTTKWASADVLSLTIVIAQRGASGHPTMFQYDYVWSPTIVIADDPQWAARESAILLESSAEDYLLTEELGLMIDE